MRPGLGLLGLNTLSDTSSVRRHLHNAMSNLTKTSRRQTTARYQGHRHARPCVNTCSRMGFLAVFAQVLPLLESEASLPWQTGRRRRAILRLTSPGRRKGPVLVLRADLLHPLSVSQYFLSRARIWMRPGLNSSLLKDLSARAFSDHIHST